MLNSETPCEGPLTADQVEFYKLNGFLGSVELMDQSEAHMVREELLRIFRERAGREVGEQFDLASHDDDDQQPLLSQIMYPAKYAPRLLETKLATRATAIVHQLLGADAECRFEHAILKPGGYGAATPWHQDAAYWSPAEVHRTLSIWIALQETTVENGCLCFIPNPLGSEVEIYNHRSIGNDPRAHGLELTPDEMHRVNDAVACPLRLGYATIHDGYTLHAAGANQTDQDRIGLVLFGKRAGVPRTVRYDFPWLEARRTARADRAASAVERDLA